MMILVCGLAVIFEELFFILGALVLLYLQLSSEIEKSEKRILAKLEELLDAHKTTYNIAKQFTDSPGGRYKKNGPKSGEEFREILEKLMVRGNRIEVNLDGTYGYATNFLEEAFGGLARKYGSDKILKQFTFISCEQPGLIKEIQSYINGMELIKNEA